MCNLILTEPHDESDYFDVYKITVGKIVCVHIKRARKGSLYFEHIGTKYFELNRFKDSILELFSNNVRYNSLVNLVNKHL